MEDKAGEGRASLGDLEKLFWKDRRQRRGKEAGAEAVHRGPGERWPPEGQCTVELKKCPDMRSGIGESTGHGDRLDVPEESRITCGWGRGGPQIAGHERGCPYPPAHQWGWCSWHSRSRRKPKPGSLPRAPAREGWAREGCPVWYQMSG